MNLPLIIDPTTLKTAMAEAGASGALKILDLRPADAFQAGHIAGARRLDATLLNRKAPPFAGLLPDEAGIRQLVAAADLCDTDHVVAVDAGAATEAARLLWVLHAWGFTATSWLDGGMRAWQDAGGALVEGCTDTAEAKPSGAVFSPQRLADNCTSADQLQERLGGADLRVLDVRSRAEYEGSDIRSAEGGHVPGALHLEWLTQLGPDGRLRDREALRQELLALDVRPEHQVVAYCQSHQRSAVTWLTLRSLGYDRVSGLDGAWSVWGNRPELPKDV